MIASFLLLSAQVILTELILGLAHVLHAQALITVNLSISMAVLILAKPHKIHIDFASIFSSLKELEKDLCRWHNIFLLVLFLFLLAWLMISILLMPPRGIDDLTCHLPAIYENIKAHKLTLLPVELFRPFAFPQNAEFILLWPMIFFKNDVAIGAAQLAAALLGVMTIFAFLRELKVSRNIAFFVSLQFLFIPLVMSQIGSGYVDLISHVYFFIVVYLSFIYFREKNSLILYLTAIAMGIVLGMKYSMIFFTGLLNLFLILALKSKRQLMLYIFFILLSGGYWYLRNWVAFKNPIYHVNLLDWGFGVFSIQDIHLSLGSIGRAVLRKMQLLILDDVGLGTLNGGFGPVIFGISFPLSLVFLWRAVIFCKKDSKLQILLWGLPLMGIGLLLVIPINELANCIRYAIFIGMVTLLALGVYLQELFLRRKILFLTLLEVFCIFSALFSMFLLSHNKFPSFAIQQPVQDYLEKRNVSRFKYLALKGDESLSYAMEALDFLTKPPSQGLACYVALDKLFFWTAPVYGGYLQNRVWNFLDTASHPPDALMYHFGPSKSIYYLKKEIPFTQTLLNSDYELIINAWDTFLFIKRDLLDLHRQALLTELYQNYLPKDSGELAALKPYLEPHIPIIGQPLFGEIMRLFQFRGMIANQVYLSPLGEEKAIADHYSFKNVYTFMAPVEGYSSEKVFEYNFNGAPVILFKNTK